MLFTQQRLPRALLAVMLIGACTSPVVIPSATGTFAVTGVALVNGTVVDLNGLPQDSVFVSGNVTTIGVSEVYPGPVSVVTGRDGRFSIRVQRLIAGEPLAPDSVRFVLQAESLRARDTNGNATLRSLQREMFIRFASPPLAPRPYATDLALLSSR